MADIVLSTTALQKSYGKRIVLATEPLSFEHGQSYALIGPNGSGKTTLLRILAGTLSPDTGTVTRTEQAAYLPQHPYGFSRSVLKNVTLALSGQDAEQSAIEALRLVGMENMASARGNKLSGGETQRMALARLLANRHKLLLLDEPTSATDIAGNDRIEAALKDYTAREGAALILCTHSLAQAARLADEIIMLYEGHIVERGCPEKLLHSPDNIHTREFLAHWAF